MLELKNIFKTFNAGTVNERVALQGVDLHLKEGEFVTVIGGNGAGKSTMLNCVAGVHSVETGKIIIDGVDVTHLPEYRRAKYIGRVFQDPMMGHLCFYVMRKDVKTASKVRALIMCISKSLYKKIFR